MIMQFPCNDNICAKTQRRQGEGFLKIFGTTVLVNAEVQSGLNLFGNFQEPAGVWVMEWGKGQGGAPLLRSKGGEVC